MEELIAVLDSIEMILYVQVVLTGGVLGGIVVGR